MAAPTKVADILVWGATGFTGQLVVKYLASQVPTEHFKLAVGGRNRDKLDKTMRDLGVEPTAVFTADSSDEAALRNIVRQVKVVASLVGPYLKHGEPLVKVCAEEGVHYVDLTGESPFIHRTTKRYTRAALDSKALIMHTSGFDSIPSDLGAFLAVQRLKQLGSDVRAGQVRSAFRAKGGLSGGTIASLMGVIENEDKEGRKLAMGPYALSPVTGVRSATPAIIDSATYKGRKTHGMFWLMAPLNEQVVNRSWGILEAADDPASRAQAYGPKFNYAEFLTMPGPISALIGSLVFFAGFASLLIPPFRWLVKKLVAKAGEGPSEEMQRKGWYEVTTIAKSEDGKKEVKVVGKGKGDPGYAATAVLISSCALCLLKDHDRLPSIAKHGGFLTPATGFGNVLVERLEKTGRFSWTVEDNQSDKDK
ncbi:hypothetical protein JCM10449v2_000598 [Rhodotorula kratochvilovae]